MTNDAVTPAEAAPAPAPQPRPNVFQRVAGAMFAPGETFADIARRPDVIGPLLLIVILGYIGTALLLPRFDFEQMTAQQMSAVKKQNPNMSEDDAERIAKFAKASTTVMSWAAPVLQIAWFAVTAGILLLAMRMFGGEGTYKQAFSATLYAWMPRVLQSIVLIVVVLARGTVDPMMIATTVKSNPAFLVEMTEHPVLYSLLSSFDVFAIWSLVLLVIGFAALSKLPRARAAVLVVSLWIVTIAIKVGFAALGASRMQG
jgi:hypothetical protein